MRNRYQLETEKYCATVALSNEIPRQKRDEIAKSKIAISLFEQMLEDGYVLFDDYPMVDPDAMDATGYKAMLTVVKRGHI